MRDFVSCCRGLLEFLSASDFVALGAWTDVLIIFASAFLREARSGKDLQNEVDLKRCKKKHPKKTFNLRHNRQNMVFFYVKIFDMKILVRFRSFLCFLIIADSC